MKNKIRPSGKTLTEKVVRSVSFSLITGLISGIALYCVGEAVLSCFDLTADSANAILLLAVLTGLITFLYHFLKCFRSITDEISALQKEIEIIETGNWEQPVLIEGEDEIAVLAASLERLRKQLISQRQKEAELRTAQKKIVRGMSHDLRTPLTGALSYIEIIREQNRNGSIDTQYIEKTYQKILQLRALADQMFEYFLADAEEKTKLLQIKVSESLEDYLSEMVMLLQADGFSIVINEMQEQNSVILIDEEYLGRIMNNLISNLKKYADDHADICLSLTGNDEFVTLKIQNQKKNTASSVSGTGIGVQNIRLMMQRMQGSTVENNTEKIYEIELNFRKGNYEQGKNPDN